MKHVTDSDREHIAVGSAVEVHIEHKTDAGWERLGSPDEISLLRWTGIVITNPMPPRRGESYEDSVINVLPDDAVLTQPGFDNGHPRLLDRKPVQIEGERRDTGEPYKELIRTVVQATVTPSQNA